MNQILQQYYAVVPSLFSTASSGEAEWSWGALHPDCAVVQANLTPGRCTDTVWSEKWIWGIAGSLGANERSACEEESSLWNCYSGMWSNPCALELILEFLILDDSVIEKNLGVENVYRQYSKCLICQMQMQMHYSKWVIRG